ncbi:hypothetical protein GCM10025857_03270 [Alicyclobacillus contaminans]|nr:hypothetical protein GCM10025857_03270 [Alicyclobacillus contaminans]
MFALIVEANEVSRHCNPPAAKEKMRLFTGCNMTSQRDGLAIVSGGVTFRHKIGIHITAVASGDL